MTKSYGDSLALSRRVLRTLIALNWIFGAAILGMLLLSLVAGAWVARALGADGDARTLLGMRLIMVVGIVGVPIANVVLTRLLAIVETVRSGDPFIGANAARLQTIAWAVLALELLRIVVAAIAGWVSTPDRPIDIHWKFSVAPWLSVLLLFVLARVFEQGARMREELEATV